MLSTSLHTVVLDWRTKFTKLASDGVAVVQAALRGHMGHFPSQPLSRRPWTPTLLTTCITCLSSRYLPKALLFSDVSAVLCQLLLAAPARFVARAFCLAR